MLKYSLKIFVRSSAIPFTQSRTYVNNSKKFTSPFTVDEAYDGYHQDFNLRNGPEIIKHNFSDFLIIGGGIMGEALAYNIWRKLERTTNLKATKSIGSCNITIVEKDPTLHESSTALSVGGIRQQFSHAANIKLSMESAEFMRKIKLNLSTIKNPEPDVQLNSQGYLIMATQSGADQLLKNYNTQTAAGAKVMLFTKDQLKETFPWLKVDDIEMATYGLENEGWFDPMSLHSAFKAKNATFPIKRLKGEIVGFKHEMYDSLQTIETNGREVDVEERIDGVYIKMEEYDKPVYIKCHDIFNCAGAASGYIAQLAGIGTDEVKTHPLLKHKLPVERRKRYVFVVHCPDAPLLDLPFVVDPSGVYVRREGLGGKYVCGVSPSEEQEPSTDNLDVDYDFFNEEIWPKLANRIPAFENLKVVSAWAGYYDYNTFDQNAVIGPHPYYHRFHFLTGFSGHGIQQACAAAEKLARFNTTEDDTLPRSPDLAPFAFDRIIDNRPFTEHNIF